MTMPDYLIVNPDELPSGSGEDGPIFTSGESFRNVSGENIQLVDCSIYHASGDKINIEEGATNKITGNKVSVTNSPVALIQANSVDLTSSSAVSVRSQDATINGTAGMLVSQSATINNSRSGLIISRDVRGTKITTIVLLAGKVNGPVETIVDRQSLYRMALIAGAAFAVVSSLFRLFRKHR